MCGRVPACLGLRLAVGTTSSREYIYTSCPSVLFLGGEGLCITPLFCKGAGLVRFSTTCDWP